MFGEEDDKRNGHRLDDRKGNTQEVRCTGCPALTPQIVFVLSHAHGERSVRVPTTTSWTELQRLCKPLVGEFDALETSRRLISDNSSLANCISEALKDGRRSVALNISRSERAQRTPTPPNSNRRASIGSRRLPRIEREGSIQERLERRLSIPDEPKRRDRRSTRFDETAREEEGEKALDASYERRRSQRAAAGNFI